LQDPVLEVAIVALLIVLNGVFAASELAVVSSRPVRLRNMIEMGRPGARAALALAAVVLAAPLAFAQGTDYKPQVGQPGKDVVWVPTPEALVDRMLTMAQLTPNDILYDLGSGDGRTVIAAAKRGVTSVGIEYNPDMAALATRNAQREGVTERARFIRGDIFETDFSKATVLTLFLLPELNRRLRPKILEMKPGTRVVSNSFDMGDWEADQKFDVSGGNCTSFCRGLFWIVPAKVQGTWKAGDSVITLEQTYQMVSGRVTTGNVVAPISGGKITGDTISFTAGGTTYTAKIDGNRMEGKAGSATFAATKG